MALSGEVSTGSLNGKINNSGRLTGSIGASGIAGVLNTTGRIAGMLTEDGMTAAIRRAERICDPAYLPPTAALVASAEETINLSSGTSYDSWTPTTTNTSILEAGSGRAACNYRLTDSETNNTALLGVCVYYTDIRYTVSVAKAYSLQKTVMGIAYYSPMAITEHTNERYGNVWYGAIGRQTYMSSASATGVYASVSYGLGPTGITWSTSSTTSATRTVGFTRPAIYARCNSSYFSTAAAGNVDSANTNIYCKYKIYAFDRSESLLFNFFDASTGIFFNG